MKKNHLSFEEKLRKAYYFMALGTFILGAIAIITFFYSGVAKKQLFNKAMEVRLISELQYKVWRLLMPGNDYIITGDKEFVNEFTQLYKDVMTDINKAEKICTSPEEIKKIKNIKYLVQKIKEKANNIFKVKLKHINKKAADLMEEMDYEAGDPAITELEKLYQIKKDSMHSIDKRINKIYIIIIFLLIIIPSVILKLTMSSSSKIITNIKDSISKITKKITQIANGEIKNTEPLLFDKFNCWEIKNCKNTTCPLYQKASTTPCWLSDQAWREGHNFQIWEEKINFCRKCEVSKYIITDQLDEIKDATNILLINLKQTIQHAELIANDMLNAPELQNKITGDLGDAFAKMIQNLSSLANKANQIANGDLTIDLNTEQKSENRVLESAFSKMVQNLRNLISSIETAADKVNQTSNDILNSAISMSEEIKTQLNQIEEASSAITEFSTSIDQIAQNAIKTDELANNSVNTTLEGTKTIQEILESFNNIKDSMETSVSKIKDLENASMAITKITGVISTIAEQTNLLALNAAIEAARAGEHGKGFAVVADEVGKLSHEVSNSVNEISTIVQTLLEQVNLSVQSINQVFSVTETGMQAISNIRQYFEEIKTEIKKTASYIAEITSATNEQASTSEQISTTMQYITNITYQTTNAFSETVNRAQNAINVAAELKKAIKQFNF